MPTVDLGLKLHQLNFSRASTSNLLNANFYKQDVCIRGPFRGTATINCYITEMAA